jgi:hypothetical protein
MRDVTPVVSVTLSKPWGPHAAGTRVEVDAIKAGTLDELGYVQHEQAPAHPRWEHTKPRRGKG